MEKMTKTKSTGPRGPLSKFDAALMKHLAKTYTVPEMAKILGCSRTTAYEYANRAGIELGSRGGDEARRAEWKAALAEEPTQSAAARRMGVSRQAASRMAARLKRKRVKDEKLRNRG